MTDNRHNTDHNPIDDLIDRYAAELRNIYDNRTAGDHTFEGVLADFVMKAQGFGR